MMKFPKSNELQKYMEYCHRLRKDVPVNKYGECIGEKLAVCDGCSRYNLVRR